MTDGRVTLVGDQHLAKRRHRPAVVRPAQTSSSSRAPRMAGHASSPLVSCTYASSWAASILASRFSLLSPRRRPARCRDRATQLHRPVAVIAHLSVEDEERAAGDPLQTRTGRAQPGERLVRRRSVGRPLRGVRCRPRRPGAKPSRRGRWRPRPGLRRLPLLGTPPGVGNQAQRFGLDGLASAATGTTEFLASTPSAAVALTVLASYAFVVAVSGVAVFCRHDVG